MLPALGSSKGCLLILRWLKSAMFAALRLLLMNAAQIVLTCGTIGIVLAYLNSLSLFQDQNVAVEVGTVGYMQMLFTGALLWGAYATIINTPALIFNIGNSTASNAVLNFVGTLPSRTLSMAKAVVAK